MAYRNCIEKLLVGKPVPTVHEISSEKRQKHVTTAKQHRSNFEKKRVSFRRLTGTMGMIAFDAPAFTGIKNIQRIGSRLAYGFLFPVDAKILYRHYDEASRKKEKDLVGSKEKQHHHCCANKRGERALIALFPNPQRA